MIKYDLNNRVAVVTGGAQGFGLANDLDIKEALSFANKVAGISTTRLGAAASMPYAEELKDN